MTPEIACTNQRFHYLSDLLSELATLSVTVAAQGERLRIEAPAGAITPELRQRLTDHKAELLDYLTSESEPTTAPPEVLRIPLSLDYSPSEWLAERGLRIFGGTPRGPGGRPLLYLDDLPAQEVAA